ncbi:MAG TPA: hypothetical protein VE978_01325 [Chitinophagales bacterium]|nr:hypothetical protein [Chitinophagales bacterium]
MWRKKLKYEEYLKQFPNCPPAYYLEIEGLFFRWVHSSILPEDFTPLGLVSETPQRILDDSDKSCMSYGLSLFNSPANALYRYKKLIKNMRGKFQREKFKQEKGNTIASVAIQNDEGVAGDMSQETGHFTFHEYEGTNFAIKCQNLTGIFTEHGEIKSEI